MLSETSVYIIISSSGNEMKSFMWNMQRLSVPTWWFDTLRKTDLKSFSAKGYIKLKNQDVTHPKDFVGHTHWFKMILSRFAEPATSANLTPGHMQYMKHFSHFQK